METKVQENTTTFNVAQYVSDTVDSLLISEALQLRLEIDSLTSMLDTFLPSLPLNFQHTRAIYTKVLEESKERLSCLENQLGDKLNQAVKTLATSYQVV